MSSAWHHMWDIRCVYTPSFSALSSLWCRCSRFPLQDQDVPISWLAPRVWWLPPSWTAAGVRESARDGRSATRTGAKTRARPSSQRSVRVELERLPTDLRVKFQRGSQDADCVCVWSHLPLQFFPKSVPAGGETVVTLCGWEFQSSLRPAIISDKTHIVTVGTGTVCSVLPPQSSSEM